MDKRCFIILGVLVVALAVQATRIERLPHYQGTVIAKTMEEAHIEIGPDPRAVDIRPNVTSTLKCWSYDTSYLLVLDEGTKRVNVHTTKDRYNAVNVGDHYEMKSGDYLNNWPTPCKRDGTK